MLMRSPVNRFIARAVLAVLSTIFSLIAVEIGYRIFLYKSRSSDAGKTAAESVIDFATCPTIYADFDKKHGERFRPNSELYCSYIKAGKVVFGTTMSRVNRDGLAGRTTLDEYRNSQYKVLVFGDSFSHWNQNNVTWPDLLQEKLSRAMGKKVAVLDHARGAYGVLQMLDLAAEKVPELNPDLVIIAVIFDDFSRDRWWTTEFEWGGFKRWMLSSRSDDFSAFYAVDRYVVHPGATREWSTQQRRVPAVNDPVLLQVNKRYEQLKADREAQVQIDYFSLKKLYLFNRTTAPWSKKSLVPRITIEDYSADAAALESCEKLVRSKVPIQLVYLPLKPEIDGTGKFLSKQDLALMGSLERMLKTSFVRLQDYMVGVKIGTIDLAPWDRHPNYDGLALYADALSRALTKSR
jgi:hypothetical protein